MHFRITQTVISIFNKQIVNLTELFRGWKRKSFQIHDYTAAMHNNSGIWNFWQEICNQYRSCDFYTFIPSIKIIRSNLMDSFLIKTNWEKSLQILFPTSGNSIIMLLYTKVENMWITTSRLT